MDCNHQAAAAGEKTDPLLKDLKPAAVIALSDSANANNVSNSSLAEINSTSSHQLRQREELKKNQDGQCSGKKVDDEIDLSDHRQQQQEMNELQARLEQLAAVEKDLLEQLAKSKRNERLLEDRIKTLQGLHERLEKEAEARKLLEVENQRLTLEIEHTRSVPRVVRTLSGGESVLGITLLDNELFVLRQRDKDQLTVYESTNYSLLRRQTLKGLSTNGWNDMASCDQNHCFYITDYQNICVHRVEPKSKPDVATTWPVNDKPAGVTVMQDRNLLITCIDARKLKEFTTHGEQLREIILDSDIMHPWHAVKSNGGRLVVCHGIGNSDPEHRVCAVNTNDDRTNPVEISQLKWPRHLAIDRDEFVFVADCFNDRVVLLSPELRFVRIVIARELQYPHRLFLDSKCMRLYIGDAVQVTVLEL